MLRHLPSPTDPRLLFGSNLADDAAVFQLTESLALAQSVDVFTPIVDDPFQFGQIAATNSLSDLYALGATPLTALNVIGFPVGKVPLEAVAEILRGGASKAAEAGVTVVGGHTVDDPEPKFGLAVTGTVAPGGFVRSDRAEPGDALVLTKPIGTGIVATALKAKVAKQSHVDQMILWMTTLNRSAAIAMLASEPHASTDVTGFGLLGHLVRMAEASGVAAEVVASAVPTLPGALEYAATGYIPGGAVTNQEGLSDKVDMAGDVPADLAQLLFDPQTSGGLLIALPDASVSRFIERSSRDMLSVVVGRMKSGKAGKVDVLP